MRRALRPVITDTFGDKTHGEGYNAEHSFQKISRRNLKVQFLRRSSGAVLCELAAFDKLVKPAGGTVSGWSCATCRCALDTCAVGSQPPRPK